MNIDFEELAELATKAGFSVLYPKSNEYWEPFIAVGGYGECIDVTKELLAFYNLIRS